MSQRQILELGSEKIAAEELAYLTKKNRELETSLRAEIEAKELSIKEAKEAEIAFEKRFKAREEELTKLVHTNMATTMHWNAVADQKNSTLEETKKELQRANEMIQLQKAQFETLTAEIKSIQKEKQELQSQLVEQQGQIEKAGGLLKSANSQLTFGRKRVEALEAQVGTLSEKNKILDEQLATAKKEAAKTPRWKIFMGVGLLIAAGLLIATGVGAVIAGSTAAVVGLGYAAFSVGMFTIGSGFLYGVYKGIRACCFPPKQSTDQEPDSSVSSQESYDSEHDRRHGVKHDSPVLDRTNKNDDALIESKHENRDRHRTTSHAANRYSQFSTTSVASPALLASPENDELQENNGKKHRR